MPGNKGVMIEEQTLSNEDPLGTEGRPDQDGHVTLEPGYYG